MIDKPEPRALYLDLITTNDPYKHSNDDGFPATDRDDTQDGLVIDDNLHIDDTPDGLVYQNDSLYPTVEWLLKLFC